MTQTLTRVAEGAVSNAEATLKRGPPTLDEQAGVLGAYLVMAGAINPNTKRPYGLDESRGVDILSIDGNQEGTTRDIGMGALAVAFLFGAPHELPDGVAPVEVNLNIGPDGKDKALVVDIATLVHNVQLIATEWGVDQALEKLSQSNSPLKPFNGKAIKQRVDEFIEKYQEFAGQYTTEELSKMLDELHGIVGKRASRVSGRIIPKILNRQRQKIPYEATADTLLHLKETGKAQCVVFSTIAAVILERLGLDPRYVSTPGHIYIQVNGLPYDGAASMNPRFLESGDQVSRVSSIVNAYIHNNYAILLKDIGRLEEAEYHYLEALRLDPDYYDAHNNYAILLKDIGRLEEAESHHLEALRLDPDYYDAHNNYAILLKDIGRLEEAESHHLEALRLNPDGSSAHNNYAILLSNIGRLEEAESHYLESLRLDPDSSRAHSNYAILLSNIGRLEEAESHYLESLRLDPDSSRAHSNYANLLKDIGRLEEAESHHLEALRLNPDGSSAHNNYAILLCVKGDIDGALKYFRSAGRKNISKSDIRNYVLMQIPIINQRIEEFNQRLDANDPKRRPLLTVPEV